MCYIYISTRAGVMTNNGLCPFFCLAQYQLQPQAHRRHQQCTFLQFQVIKLLYIPSYILTAQTMSFRCQLGCKGNKAQQLVP